MSDEEGEVFRGDRPRDHSEQVERAPSKEKPQTSVVKADDAPAATSELLVSEEHPDLDGNDQFASDDVETAEPSVSVEPEYHFEVDPESLWTMPPAMQERVSGLASFVAMTNQRLDDQEKATARIIKALKQLA